MQDDARLRARLARIRRKIIVMSGKGGVGKSTVAVNLAMTAMLSGRCVGLLDVDLHGPSVPTMLGLVGHRLENGGDGMLPVRVGGLKVVSVGLLLQNRDDPVIWRGPMKMGVIRQFIEDVDWGDLDLLVVDAPPGTGDEPLSVCQLIPGLDGAVIVTTPQKVATEDVRRSINFCKELGVRVLGVVENMSGFACPKCGEVTPILRAGGGRVMAEEMKVPFLGSIPIDPQIAESGDEGRAFVESVESLPAARAFHEIARGLMIV
jgi:Mrp family chromosome partitioning ATPase